jgi:thiol-disulfide isomerase/thioredoxin
MSLLSKGFSLLLLLVLTTLQPAQGSTDASVQWLQPGAGGEPRVMLYLFWSLTCPHCQDARPVVLSYADQHDWIQVIDLEITRSESNRETFRNMAQSLGLKARSVPTFFVCGKMLVGWDNAESMGRMLLQTARSCRPGVSPDKGLPPPEKFAPELPLGLDADQLSLPLFTLVIAALDAFNPCAFFILLFLLSLLVQARSRRRMLLVGMTFVLVSGVVYFLFMAAWLNLFLLVGSMPWITSAAGLLAVLIGVINTREVFVGHNRATLSIPQSAKPGLYQRMGRLLSVDSMPTLLAGTVMLAIAVNSYELLCTAGFPMVYTRTLTLHHLDSLSYYLYLGLYNVVYVIPLLVIVSLFTWTLGSRKLRQSEGKSLKLLSGLMMLMLGMTLMFAPELLSNLATGLLLVSVALVLTVLITRFKKSAV